MQVHNLDLKWPIRDNGNRGHRYDYTRESRVVSVYGLVRRRFVGEHNNGTAPLAPPAYCCHCGRNGGHT